MNFNPFTSVIVTFDAGRGGRPESFQTRTDGFGHFAIATTPSSRSAGSYIVRADDLKRREAEATFNVPCRPLLPPRLVFDPPIGPPGFVTLLRGTGFPPGAAVDLTWTETLLPSAYDNNLLIGTTGEFELRVLIFRHDTLGIRHVRATPAGSSVVTFPTLTADFLVVPGRQQPRDFAFRR